MTRGSRGGTMLVLTLAFAVSGCATLFSGTSDEITFESTPAGAMVQIDGVDKGRTPLTTEVKRNFGGTDVTYRLDGYETRTFELGQEFNTTAVANLLCIAGILVCAGIDVLTGAIMKYDPRSYSMELTPRGDLEEELEVEEVVYDYELQRDADGLPMMDRIRPNVALVNSATGQIAIFR